MGNMRLLMSAALTNDLLTFAFASLTEANCIEIEARVGFALTPKLWLKYLMDL